MDIPVDSMNSGRRRADTLITILMLWASLINSLEERTRGPVCHPSFGVFKMVSPLLSFFAEKVAVETTEYTPEYIVYMIAVGTGDPEKDGHCWTFSRSFDDEDGVCTVREIQRAVF
jgi:hypothetical protein